MNKRFRACDLDQVFLLPPSLQDWLPEDHLARFIADVMNELDLSALYAKHERADGRGLAAYHPLMMTRLLLYGYCLGITSSRKIEKATHEDVAFRYLAADQHPDHDTIASYRQENLEDLAGIFVQVLRLCQKAGLVKLGNIAIDGTKMLANASTRRSVPYAKLAEREKHWLEEVERLLREARERDQEEDARYGKGQTENPLPAELAHAQSRLQRIQEAKAALEEEAQAQLQAASENYVPGKRGRPRKGDQPASPGADQTAADERKGGQDQPASPATGQTAADECKHEHRSTRLATCWGARHAIVALAQVRAGAPCEYPLRPCRGSGLHAGMGGDRCRLIQRGRGIWRGRKCRHRCAVEFRCGHCG